MGSSEATEVRAGNGAGSASDESGGTSAPGSETRSEEVRA
jgi:hypothetical protein